MYALAFALTLAAATAVTSDRAGYDREIDAYNQVPKLLDYVLNEDYLHKQRNRGKLITRLRPEEAVASDNVILESNIVKILKPKLDGELVRQRRGYNLENVIVPARYPYLPVSTHYNRFRKWG